MTTPRRVVLYEWVGEGGPGGERREAALWEAAGWRWLYALTPNAPLPPPPAGAPQTEGWQPFYGPEFAPGVLAATWVACVQAPETWWWDDPKT